MKRYLPLLMIIIFPYFGFVLPVLAYFTRGNLAEIVFAAEGGLLLVSWLFVYVIALVCSLIVLIVSLVTKRNSQEMLHNLSLF
jgi:hypothetical protein